MMGMFGKKTGQGDVSMAYPYFSPELTPEEVLAQMKAADGRLHWDGTRHVWMN